MLVLAHSLGTDRSLWEPQLPALERRFRVLRPDLRGHGAAPVVPGPCTIEHFARDVLAAVDALGVDRFRFCGLSLGGLVGQWLALHAPERIERLVLCSTAARIGTPAAWAARIAAVRAGGLEPLADATLERWFTPAFRARAPAVVMRARATLLATPLEGYLAACAAIRDFDARDAVAGVRTPTLVIAGRADSATPPADAAFLAARIPDARLVELPAAHLANLEAVEAFTAALLDFL